VYASFHPAYRLAIWSNDGWSIDLNDARYPDCLGRCHVAGESEVDGCVVHPRREGRMILVDDAEMSFLFDLKLRLCPAIYFRKTGKPGLKIGSVVVPRVGDSGYHWGFPQRGIDGE